MKTTKKSDAKRPIIATRKGCNPNGTGLFALRHDGLEEVIAATNGIYPEADGNPRPRLGSRITNREDFSMTIEAQDPCCFFSRLAVQLRKRQYSSAARHYVQRLPRIGRP